MPDIPVSSQIFDVAFHPCQSVLHAALLDGHIRTFGYDDQGKYEQKFVLRPSRKSCRGLDVSQDGERLWAVGKSKVLYTVDTTTGTLSDTIADAHDAAINRVKRLMPNMLSTGDDDGVVKLWDPRKREPVNTYTHHFDFISDFLWLEDKKHLVCTSGDGTLSVLDVRSKQSTPFAQSEDQEDELLSILAIKGAQKLVVGTQLGILTLFNRRSGYSDCVDRVPGHPYSIDALANVPSRYPNAQSTILTGSSDGLVRVVELFPSKLLGVVADHGEFPVERVKVDMDGEGNWVASVGHEEVIKLTDLREVFEDGDRDGEQEAVDDSEDEIKSQVELEEKYKDDSEDSSAEDSDSNLSSSGRDLNFESTEAISETKPNGAHSEDKPAEKSDSDSDVVNEKRKRKKQEKDPFRILKRPKGRNELEADSSFFADL